MRQTDPLRSRKADRWDALTKSGVSPDEATRRVEEEFSSPQPAATKTTPSKPSLTLGEQAAGAVRSLMKGATYGLYEDLASLPYALPGGRTREEERQRIRGETAKYREANPGMAIAGEIVGGLATGPAGVVRSTGKVGLREALKYGAKRAVSSGAGQGAIAGFGEAEGGVGNRLAGATVGATTGGLAGGVLGKAGRMVGERVARGGPKDVGANFAADLMQAAKTRPAAVRQEAARLAQIAPEARLADITGEAGQRAARGQAGFGGPAGEEVATAMRERFAGRPKRMQDVLTRSTGKTPESMVETLDDFRKSRKAAADPLYEAAFANPPIVDEALESFIEQRPSLKLAQQEAAVLMKEAGRPLQMIENAAGEAVPLRTPEFLDYMKGALDDILYKGKKPGEGGLGLRRLGKVQETRNEFVGMLDDMIPGYREARAAYAGDTALIQAMEEGADLAAKRTRSTEVKQVLDAMGDSEREMFQRGYLDTLRNRIDEDKLKPAQLRSPAFAKQIETVFGADAPAVLDGLAADLRLMETASMVQAGSRTAPTQVDIGRAEARSRLGQAAMSARTAYRDPFTAAARGFDFLAEPFSSAAREARRGTRTETLLTPAAEIGPLLDRVQREMAAQRTGQAIGQQIGRRTGRVAGQQSSAALFGNNR